MVSCQSSQSSIAHSYESVIQRERRYNRLIALRAFLEFSHIKTAVLVFVHHTEDLAYTLLRSIFIFWKLHHRTDLCESQLA